MISLIIVATIIGGPAALAQTSTPPNSGAGVPGLLGNKSGPADRGQIRREQRPRRGILQRVRIMSQICSLYWLSNVP